MSTIAQRIVALFVVPGLLVGGLPLTAQAASVGAGEGQLDIVAWAGYIERGETDKAYDWVTDFEKSTGARFRSK